MTTFFTAVIQVVENLGMVMIFTLVSGVQDKLAEVLDMFKKEKEQRIKDREEELKRIEEVCFFCLLKDKKATFSPLGKVFRNNCYKGKLFGVAEEI